MLATDTTTAERPATRFAKDQLKSFVERIERLEEEKKEIGDDVKSVYAEAKSNGFDMKAMRALIRLRKQDANDRQEQEALLETYMHAVGMLTDAPLFAAVGALSVDVTARDQVIEAFKQLVPASGEVIIKMGGNPVRLFRDVDGKAHAEDYVESKAAPPVKPGKKLREPATVLTMVPPVKPGTMTPDEVKKAADEAEAAADAKAKRPHDDGPTEQPPA